MISKMQLLISSSLTRLLYRILMQTSTYFLKNSVSIYLRYHSIVKSSLRVSLMSITHRFWFSSTRPES